MSQIDVDHLPDRDIPATRQDAIRELLLDQTTSRGRRHRTWWVAAASAGLMLAGGGAAAAYVTAQHAAPSDSVYCYSMPQAGAGDDFPGTTVTLLDGDGGTATVEDAVATCAQAWRDGVVVQGSREVGANVTPGGNRPVPQLVACVRTDDAVAVMPGGPGVCRENGMTDFAGYQD